MDLKSVAILRLAALGDVCMTIPLVRRLQRYLPNTKIYWIISRPLYGFVRDLSGFEFIVIDKPRSITDYVQCYRHFKSYNFDVLLMPQANFRAHLLSLLIRAKVKYGYQAIHNRELQRLFVNKTVYAAREHLIDSFLRFAEPFGSSDTAVTWDLSIAAENQAWAEQQLSLYPGPWLAISPAASKSERNWPIDRYIATVNQLAEQKTFSVVLLGAGSEIEQYMGAEISKNITTPCVNLIGKSNLFQLTAVLNQVDVLLSPDTGTVHIATACDTPVVGLYAVAPANKSGPYHSLALTVDKYRDAVRSILDKDPDTVGWHERVHSPAAMELITVEEVVAKLQQALVAKGVQ